ncbi:MAG: beta-lactamase family protein [Lachnospiraceae bacterium]|nr:beta-lactamase family protein [Lachnospiraceae bacterium]
MDFSKLTRYLDDLQETVGMPMGDCRIMKDHEEIYRHSFGYADLQRTVPIGAQHLYRLFSATKVITMTAVMQLIEQGKISLTDELDRFLPEFATMQVAEGDRVLPAKKKIRICDLMTMTAGFSYDTDDPNIRRVVKESGGRAGTREIVSALAKTPLLFEPGTHWSYSLCHDVLAAVVETVSGMRFSDYLQKNIFGPLGAKDLYFRWKDDEKIRSRVAAIYMATDGEPPFVKDDGTMSDCYIFTENYESGGAGLVASVNSYSLIADALSCGGLGKSGERILKEESVAMFTRPYPVSEVCRSDFGGFNRTGYDYGLGVRVMVDNSFAKSPVGEFGWDGAAGAFVLMDTENKLSVFYAEHVLGYPYNYDVIHPTLRDLVYEGLNK